MAGGLDLTFAVNGVQQFLRMLAELARVPVGPAGQNAVNQGAELIATRMRENIRGHGLVLTGQMLGSIDVTPDKEAKKEEPTAYVGSRLFYAKFSEFGTVHQAAKPWARPAMDEGGKAAVDKIGLVVGEEIETVAARAAGTAPK